MAQTEKRPVLGVLGGLGPAASCYLYQMLIDHTPASRDQDHIDVVISSRASTRDGTAYIKGESTDNPFAVMEQDGRSLVAYGATVLAIPCNTSHYFVDKLQGDIHTPILHMIRETAAAIYAQGRRRPAILATDGTIQSGLYQAACAQYGLEAVAPDAAIQALVMSIIYDEIKQGERGSREKFAAIDKAMRQAGCDCAILACTELSVFRTYHNLPPFYVDAMAVLAERAVQACGKPLRHIFIK